MARRAELLELAVLGLLHESPMHGYELRKRLNAALGSFRALSYGSLYPALRDARPRPDRRGTAGAGGSGRRRARIVYELTADGKERFQELVDQAGPRPGRTTRSASTSPSSPAPTARGAAAHPRGPAGRLEERLARSAGLGAATGSGWTPTRELQRHGLERPSARSAGWNELITRANVNSGPADRTEPPTRRPPWDPSASPSSASATAPARSSRASSTTRTRSPRARARPHARRVRRLPRPRRGVRRRLRRRRQEGRHGPRRGDQRQSRTTPSRSPTCRRPASPCSAATPSTASASTTARPSTSPRPSRSTSSRRCARREVDVLVCYLPVGSEEAEKFYAQCAIDAGVAFVNALPVFIAGTRSGRRSSRRPACRSSVTTSSPRSARPSRTGCWPSCSRTAASSSTGPTSSTSAATWTSRTCSSGTGWSPRRSPRPSPSRRTCGTTSATRNVHIGPSDYVAWLDDRKWAYIRLEGRAFGDVPLKLEYKLEVWDSPNSAGIIIDAIRAAKIAQGPWHRRPAAVGVVVLHEVPAGAVRRRPRAAPSSRPTSRAPKSADVSAPSALEQAPPLRRGCLFAYASRLSPRVPVRRL